MKPFRTIPARIMPGPDEGAREALARKRAELAAELAQPLAPGEIRPAYLARVQAGPVPVLNLKGRRP